TGRPAGGVRTPGIFRTRSGGLTRLLLELDGAVADLDVEVLRRDGRQLDRGQADDIQHGFLGRLQRQLLARLYLDRRHLADLRAVHGGRALEGDDQASARVSAGDPLHSGSGLDVL